MLWALIFLYWTAEESLFHFPAQANTVLLQRAGDSPLLLVTSDLDSTVEGVNLASSKYGSHMRQKNNFGNYIWKWYSFIKP